MWNLLLWTQSNSFLCCVFRSWCWRCRMTPRCWRPGSRTRRWWRNTANPSGRWLPCVYRRTRRRGAYSVSVCFTVQYLHFYLRSFLKLKMFIFVRVFFPRPTSSELLKHKFFQKAKVGAWPPSGTWANQVSHDSPPSDVSLLKQLNNI